ncbi:hypothetical protein [Candidatus Deianiraea vastatrix]|uniref:MFS transporter n=1 Tax=Candidatus Deianiraea vastatrix TaxID=2163644 RepID=A0A5B8XH60_9RICK|nr:hypothetical protein [Candidatus Deianiraea vastatrix]QED23187.1 hypothetical protein Deia_00384 [Candidatus Deianiraea vastatrix]
MKIIFQNNNILKFFTISITRISLDQYIILNYIMLISNFSIQKLGNINFFSLLFALISMLLSGIIYDKFSHKLFFKLGIFISFLSSITLFLSTKHEVFIYFFAILYPISQNFFYGKNEAFLFQSVKNNIKNTSIFPRILSFFYGISDFIKFLSSIISTILISFHSIKYIQYYLVFFTFFQALCILIFTNFTQNKKSQSKNSLFAIKCLIFGRLKYTILLFSIYTSIMYLYKEILVLVGKIYDVSAINIGLYKAKYHLFLSLGCLIPLILKPHFFNKKAPLFSHIIPIISLICITIFAVQGNYIYIIYCLFAISLSFCAFEISLDLKGNRLVKEEVIGTFNSILWTVSLLFSVLMSGLIAILLKYMDGKIALNIIFSIYAIAVIFASILQRRSVKI